jgi:flavodoxin
MKKNILIVYASNSGANFLVAEAIKKILDRQHAVVMQKAVDTNPEDLQNFDLVILGSPSWRIPGMGDGLPQETMLALIKKCAGKKLPEKQFAVFGCEDKSYTFFCGAVNFLENFVASVQGKKIIDSLRINGYFFNLEKNEDMVQKWGTELLGKIN